MVCALLPFCGYRTLAACVFAGACCLPPLRSVAGFALPFLPEHADYDALIFCTLLRYIFTGSVHSRTPERKRTVLTLKRISALLTAVWFTCVCLPTCRLPRFLPPRRHSPDVTALRFVAVATPTFAVADFLALRCATLHAASTTRTRHEWFCLLWFPLRLS